jgi:hypothetical protein
MYSRAVALCAPFIARRQGGIVIPPDREQIKAALGKERPVIAFRARSAFIDSLEKFMSVKKGGRALITPSPSTHHSAQFPEGTFEITECTSPPPLRDPRGLRRPQQRLHQVQFHGAESPVWVEGLTLPPEAVKFIILRPKRGKLGTPSVNRWEILVFSSNPGYLIDHVDSDLNPKFSGIF